MGRLKRRAPAFVALRQAKREVAVSTTDGRIERGEGRGTGTGLGPVGLTERTIQAELRAPQLRPVSI
jgi:hypothetical protein